MDVLGCCDETTAWVFDYLHKHFDKLATVAMRLQVSPTVNGVGGGLSRLVLRKFELDEDLEAYPCRLCNIGFSEEDELHEHVKVKHAASYAHDLQRGIRGISQENTWIGHGWWSTGEAALIAYFVQLWLMS